MILSQNWFWQWLVTKYVTSHYLKQWWPSCWYIYMSLGHDELNHLHSYTPSLSSCVSQSRTGIFEEFWQPLFEPPVNSRVKLCEKKAWCDDYTIRDQPRYAPSQWETALHCNDISHWLGAYLDWSLYHVNIWLDILNHIWPQVIKCTMPALVILRQYHYQFLGENEKMLETYFWIRFP